ncbi:MAG: hypothetical protein V2G41_10125 [bacterium JZ-2024 1]
MKKYYGAAIGYEHCDPIAYVLAETPAARERGVEKVLKGERERNDADDDSSEPVVWVSRFETEDLFSLLDRADPTDQGVMIDLARFGCAIY